MHSGFDFEYRFAVGMGWIADKYGAYNSPQGDEKSGRNAHGLEPLGKQVLLYQRKG
jgi:hypothetical protein